MLRDKGVIPNEDEDDEGDKVDDDEEKVMMSLGDMNREENHQQQDDLSRKTRPRGYWLAQSSIARTEQQTTVSTDPNNFPNDDDVLRPSTVLQQQQSTHAVLVGHACRQEEPPLVHVSMIDAANGPTTNVVTMPIIYADAHISNEQTAASASRENQCQENDHDNEPHNNQLQQQTSMWRRVFWIGLLVVGVGGIGMGVGIAVAHQTKNKKPVTIASNTTQSPTQSPTHQATLFPTIEQVTLPLEYIEECSPEFPCGKCQGDCDSDRDCAGSLQCTPDNRGAIVPVPGCIGTPSAEIEYCHSRPLQQQTPLVPLLPDYNWTWQQIGSVLDGESPGDHFGVSVALSWDGRTLAVGSEFNNDNGPNAGHIGVYEFDSNGNAWNQLGQDLEGTGLADEFGISMALSADGSILAGGACFNDDNGHDAGHVRVYQYDRSTNTWPRLGQVLLGDQPGDYFGWSVALSDNGKIMAAGAYENGDLATGAGHVRVFYYNDTNEIWEPLGQTLSGNATGGSFGWSLALSGDGSTVAGGAHEYDDNDRIGAGLVRVYEYDTSTELWLQVGQDLTGDQAGDAFGSSVALSDNGKILAVGAQWSDSYGTNAGLARVYEYNVRTKQWQRLGLSDLVGEAANDQFGWSVAISGDGSIVAVGADESDANGLVSSGRIRAFWYDSDTQLWQPLGDSLDGEDARDDFGISVALSKDGSVLAGGAYLNDGVAGEDSGHVRVFGLAPANA